MDRLLPSDPSVIGEYRLAARLGAGGMGVVYLARSPLGTWCALKSIRAEHADDPGFRARFRRETELAARLGGRWTVPVLAADAEARSPWLATAYVPGPSLAEAIVRHGPWPAPQLRCLGTALAEALEEVHGCDLVHRDVKPANILLAADGPRLIDFGIARAVGVTALTTDGSVIGSPGYLSPEQARGRTVGPPSDVFSLGCVLAHAATGRPVFGIGGAAGVLYRTVHEEPDVDGVPEALAGIVRRCLSKSPEQRPQVAELRDFLGPFDERNWLPEGLPALVAARAARVLDLPVPQGTVTDGTRVADLADALTLTAEPATSAPTTRRRVLAAGGAVLGVGTIGVGSWWRWGRSDPSGTTGSGNLPRHVLGLLGDRSDAVFTAQERGARLAVSEHNADDRRVFDLVLRTADDGGTAKRAAAAAGTLAADPDLVGVIGAGTNTTAPAVMEACAQAGVTHLVTRADSSELSNVNVTTTLLLRPTKTAGPPAILRYLNRVVKPARTAVVHDLSDADATLPTVRMATVHRKLNGDTLLEDIAPDRDFDTAARRITDRDDDAVLFAGIRPDRAAACARALRRAGYRGPCVADEHVLGARFLAAADGWLIGTGYTDAADPRIKAFTAAHRARFGAAPAPWAAEAYDAVRFVAHGLTAAGDDARSALRSELLRHPWQGITRRASYDRDSQFFVTGEDAGEFLYRVTDSALRFVSRADDIGGAATN
ncbi:bifunctional serine/threonine-protein kinase/ABC transporter substrate-binding protein [Streptomyces cinnabarinus]|uniref:Bifunctional serine/threonine-protein kinase/ABC transporter substrate-binding protein n=1 Tax=Streptomyces cinnabarinus TaxID=67287 RepID=A0ABY7KS66_9ACTN|nr:bifunctional serine/threonine-protein kinase/ABC transporter substrate-binding protein [Streptomyces cinnabarinus]WAZ26217.1 bifunctional serine/threonine-protein kinase/ABC transporter substrate-binding protein [Streptomyces cinnabarinus]